MVEIKNLNFDFSDNILRKHNQETYKKVVYSLMKGKKTLFEQATGTGKSYISCKLLRDYGSNQRALFVCSSEAIETQFKKDFQNWVVGKGTTDCQLDTCLYQGLNRVKKNEYDIIIFDEVHRMGAKTWGPNSKEVMNNNPNALVVGMTATLERPDGFDVKQYFDNNNPVSSLSLAQALERGILPCPNYVLAKVNFNEDEKYVDANLKEFKLSLKEAETANEKKEIKEKIDMLRQARKDISKREEIPQIFAKEFTEEMKNGKFIVFCPAGGENDIDSAEATTYMKQIMKQSKNWFSEVDGVKKIKRYSCYSGLDNKINEHVIKAFEEDNSNSLKLLFSVNMLNEGLHVKDINGVIMLRSTSSNIVYLQQLGRAMSVGGDNPTIFDLVANLNSVDIENAQQLVKAVNHDKDKNRGTFVKDKEKDEDYKYLDTRFKLTTYNYDEIQLIEELKQNIFNYNKEHSHIVRALLTVQEELTKNNKIISHSDKDKQRAKIGQIVHTQLGLLNKIGIENYQAKYPERFEILNKIKNHLETDHVLERLNEGVKIFEQTGKIPTTKSDNPKFKQISVTIHNEIAKLREDPEKYMQKYGERYEAFVKMGLANRTYHEKLDDQWTETFEKVKKYFDENGKLPSQGNPDQEIDKLAGWVTSQKMKFRNEKYQEKYPDRIEQLKYLGFTELTPQEQKLEDWLDKYESVQQYFNEKGKTPPKTSKDPDVAALGRWIDKQIQMLRNNSNLKEDNPIIYQKLYDILGDRMLTPEERWQNNAKSLEEYIEKNGKMPSTIDPDKKIAKLADWVGTQRKNLKQENFKEKQPDKYEFYVKVGLISPNSSKLDNQSQQTTLNEQNQNLRIQVNDIQTDRDLLNEQYDAETQSQIIEQTKIGSQNDDSKNLVNDTGRPQ